MLRKIGWSFVKNTAEPTYDEQIPDIYSNVIIVNHNDQHKMLTIKFYFRGGDFLKHNLKLIIHRVPFSCETQMAERPKGKGKKLMRASGSERN